MLDYLSRFFAQAAPWISFPIFLCSEPVLLLTFGPAFCSHRIMSWYPTSSVWRWYMLARNYDVEFTSHPFLFFSPLHVFWLLRLGRREVCPIICAKMNSMFCNIRPAFSVKAALFINLHAVWLLGQYLTWSSSMRAERLGPFQSNQSLYVQEKIESVILFGCQLKRGFQSL